MKLAQQLKREQTAHQQTLARQEEIADELKNEQERRETREKEIATIQAALEKDQIARYRQENTLSSLVQRRHRQFCKTCHISVRALLICDNKTRFRLRNAMWVGEEMLFEYLPVVFLNTLCFSLFDS